MTQNVYEQDLVSAVRAALQDVKDPEIPTLSLEELGMVYDLTVQDHHAKVQLIPTFVGCPAVEMIRRLVENNVGQVKGIESVQVEFVMDVPWSSDRITEEGRRKLAEFGISPPPHEFLPGQAPVCSYCGSSDTDVVSIFGPTACRAVYYCKQCSQPFEGMKYV
ncbi:phenylacetate-CoA oxygenase subunit PaaJ [Alicyclobacillus tolerans]|uniref:1,2-phenylacetyl-CoA epoxidase subunit PaaD n=1 Tax=Alicyclobacillus tolerans TaxID=90970 RepID=UPI001F01AD4E|nr:1,2-phenylacetyl-CoA epoxidase subunit PaaD [Alicyclobacillus tolerans]MCF8568086.1 phenylacetate-CoA oxygenase subunit PaaJ [Alicyclobacillus tolerans]